MPYDSTVSVGLPGRPKSATVKHIQFPFDTALGETSAPKVLWGTGSPESNVVGNVGDFFIQRNGTANEVVHLKVEGTGNTGWARLITWREVGGLQRFNIGQIATGETPTYPVAAHRFYEGVFSKDSGPGNPAVLIGDVLVDTASRIGRMAMVHRLNAEEPLCLLYGEDILTGAATLRIGGGNANLNAFREIELYGAADDTTLTGTILGKFSTLGLGAGAAFFVRDIGTGTLKQVQFGANDSGGSGFKLLRVVN